MNWSKIWNDIVNFFTTNVWNILLFFAVLLIGIIVIKLLLNILRRVLNKTKLEKIAVGFFIVVIKLVLYLCLILALLSIIGVNINGVLTALSALVLAIGLALQNIIANAANGLIIISNKMFKKGDYISVNGVEGSVLEINFLFTTLKTPDNKRITLPNSTIVNQSVIDYDSNKTRRVDIKFEVSYESDVENVKKVILDCIKSNGKVLLDPEPTCRLNALNSSGIEFVSKCWCDREDYWDVYFDLMELVFNELKRNNISIPYNQLEIRERQDVPQVPVNGDGLPLRVEKVREEDRNFDLETMNLTQVFSHKTKKKDKKKGKKGEKTEDKAENQEQKISEEENTQEIIEEKPIIEEKNKKKSK